MKRDTVTIDRELVEKLIEFVGEDLGCDHSVNICMCEIIGVVDETNRQMRGKKVCPKCHGEGCIWDEKLARRQDKIDREKGFDPYDQNGMKQCSKCAGKGEVWGRASNLIVVPE